jgi:hypothetical protein
MSGILERPAALGALPNAETNVLLFPDTDDATNRAVADHQDGLTDWSHGPFDLSRLVRLLRSWSRDLLEHFFPPMFGSKRVRPPEFLFRFEREAARVLGHYVPGRNDVGLRWEISTNPRHLATRSERQIAAVLLHELLHWFEEAVATPPHTVNGYHSAWFRRFATDFGIPCTRYGAERGIVTPSRFSAWADASGLLGDPLTLPIDDAPDPAPVGKRVPWVCSCSIGELVTVQVPRGSELLARCERCGDVFKRKERHE